MELAVRSVLWGLAVAAVVYLLGFAVVVGHNQWLLLASFLTGAAWSLIRRGSSPAWIGVLAVGVLLVGLAMRSWVLLIFTGWR